MRKVFTNAFGRSREYEIVERIPYNYEVWNIGENMGSDEYIPFCETYGDLNHIVIKTLKAIKLPKEEVRILRKLASKNTTNLYSVKEMIRNKKNINLAVKALPILERITM